jgi:hypothetical protein
MPTLGLPLLAVSGDEVAVALQRAGFQLVSRSPGRTVLLTRGMRDVLVPAGPIAGEMLRTLLRAAGLSYSLFLDLLHPDDERCASGVVSVPPPTR